jgi:hypothetical protein
MNNTDCMVEANRLNETRLGRLVEAKLAEIGDETEWGYLNIAVPAARGVGTRH